MKGTATQVKTKHARCVVELITHSTTVFGWSSNVRTITLILYSMNMATDLGQNLILALLFDLLVSNLVLHWTMIFYLNRAAYRKYG